MTIMKTLTVNGVTYEVATPVPVTSVILLASAWVGEGRRYSQEVSVAGITAKSQVNLTPTDEQMDVFYDEDLTFSTVNKGGIVTVSVVGQKPEKDYTIPVNIVEVITNDDEIYGIPVATPLNPEKIVPNGVVKTVNGVAPDGNGNVVLNVSEDVNAALAEAKASGEFKGEPGEGGVSATHEWNGTVLTVSSASGTSSADLKGEPGENGVSPAVAVSKSGKVTTIVITDANGTKTATINDGSDGGTGATGPAGKDGKDGKDGNDYVLTAANKAEIAEMVDGATIVQAPTYVDSVDKMTDTSKVYVLAETGHIWSYMDTTVEKEVTVRDDIIGTTDNPYQVGRLSSNGGFGEATAGYLITPYIDLTQAKYAGKTIELHLDGIKYVKDSDDTDVTYVQFAIYKTDKSTLQGRSATSLSTSESILPVIKNVKTVINGETSATLTITVPPTYNSTTIGYFRFCGKGTEAASDVYITYKEVQTVTGGQWVDTGTTYAPTLTDADKQAMVDEIVELVDTQLLTMIGDGVVTV